MEKTVKKFIIIDGNAVVHRAYHAIPPLTTKEGLMVNAVYGFAMMLLKVLDNIKPDYCAVAFDVAGGTFRDALFTEYKAKRIKADQELYDQIPLIHNLVAAFGIPVLTREGYEADDIIGAVVERFYQKEKKLELVILSGDMDLLQLVRDRIKVFSFKKGLSEFTEFDPAAVKEKYGFGPEQVVDYKALRGDASDNIPGVPGIGEKTATLLLQKIGGIEEIYSMIKKNNDQLTKNFSSAVLKKLIDGEASARMSYEVATVCREVPGLEFSLADCETKPLNRGALLPLFQRFGFVSLTRRLSEEDKKTKKKSTVSQGFNLKIRNIGTGESKKIISQIRQAGKITIKEVVAGNSILTGAWQGFIFAHSSDFLYVDWEKLNEIERHDWQEFFLDKDVVLFGHDLKQLVKTLFFSGIKVHSQLFDIMIASYVLNSGTRAHDLVSIALRELGEELPSGAQSSLFGSDLASVANELSIILRVSESYRIALEKNKDEKVFDEIEMALIPVLAQMELYGVALDVHYLKELSGEAQIEVNKLTKKIWREAGEEFNIASPVQLRDILYEKMGLKLPGIKKGKTCYSTSASELEKMRGTHPIIEHIEDFRELTKLQNTYLEVLPTLVNPKTHRIHTSFNQAVAATGRLSSSDPNLQNIPIRTDLGRKIRHAFVAEKGKVLIVADYSQFELRIVASLANDAKLIEIFKRGEDVHKATAAIVNNVLLDEVTPDMRRAAKEVNFGVLYGMGVYGLSSRTGISQFEAKDFIEKYFQQFSGVKKYIDDTIAFARKEGYVETLFGRRRYISEIQSDNYQLRSAGERMAVNMPVQGTQADLVKMAMITIAKYLADNYPNGEVKMILQVHDELVFEVSNDLESVLIPIIKEKMINVIKLKVPIEVSVGVGKNWGEAK